MILQIINRSKPIISAGLLHSLCRGALLHHWNEWLWCSFDCALDHCKTTPEYFPFTEQKYNREKAMKTARTIRDNPELGKIDFSNAKSVPKILALARLKAKRRVQKGQLEQITPISIKVE